MNIDMVSPRKQDSAASKRVPLLNDPQVIQRPPEDVVAGKSITVNTSKTPTQPCCHLHPHQRKGAQHNNNGLKHTYSLLSRCSIN